MAANLRAFNDYGTTRNNILTGVQDAVAAHFPLANDRYTIDVADLSYDRSEPYTFPEQSDAILKNQSLFYRLRGRMRMTDNATGQVIDESTNPITLARVPFITERGTFINKGSEYTVANQSRLLPGVYTRQKESGEYEAHFNAMPGRGRGFHIVLEPETGRFLLNIGQAKLPLYPILLAMGLDERYLERIWGKDLLEQNRYLRSHGEVLRKAYERFTGKSAKNLQDSEIGIALRDAFSTTELDPQVTGITLTGGLKKLSSIPMMGTLKIERGIGNKYWGYLTIPQSFADAVYYALRDSDEEKGISPNPYKAHVTVLREEECMELKNQYGKDWQQACGNGRRFRIDINNVQDLNPNGWNSIDRVWMVSATSPELRKFRRSLGLSELPKHQDFHISVGVRRAGTKRASELDALVDEEPVVYDLPLDEILGQPPAGYQLHDLHDELEMTLAEKAAAHVYMNKKAGTWNTTPIDLTPQDLTSATPITLLRATQKLLNINGGYEDIDDRDSLSFQRFYGPEDFFTERIQKDAGGVLRGTMFKATNRGNLTPFRQAGGVFNPHLTGVLIGSGLGAPIEEVNPIEIMDQNLRVIRSGEGGISDPHRVPVDSRSVQPTHFGFLDPILTPECFAEDTEVFTSTGWKPWSVVAKRDKLACQLNGQLVFRNPIKLIAEPYKGLMYGAKTKYVDYLVTPNHRMWVRPYFDQPTEWRFETAEYMHLRPRHILTSHNGYEGDYSITHFELPKVDGPGNLTVVEPIDIVDWAEFFGWYLAEGNTNIQVKKGQWRVQLSQKSSMPFYDELLELLARLPFKSYRHEPSNKWDITGKQLASYLQQFGKSYEKYLPEEVFEWPLEARIALLKTFNYGDGRKDKKNPKGFTLCTTSYRLAKDLERLLITCGYAVTQTVEPDKREYVETTNYIVFGHAQKHRAVLRHKGKHPFYTKEYDGMVYCAEVPGGLLYVRRNNCTPYWTGNSRKAGIDQRLTINAMKGDDGQVYSMVRNAKTGKLNPVSARDLSMSTFAFPGEIARSKAQGIPVRAMRSGRITYVQPEEVDYELAHPQHMFNFKSNLVPGISGMKGGRLLMGAKFFTQALPIRDAQAPFVQSQDPDGTTFDAAFGKNMGTVAADPDLGPGTVVEVNPDYIKVRHRKGMKKYPIYNNLPFNRKTYIHNDPVVNFGDRIQPGQLLAKSNFTDMKGELAMGQNLRTAYMVWGDTEEGGANFEDGVVISDTAAKRMSSEHMYLNGYDKHDAIKADRRKYVSLFPGKFNKAQLKTIDDKGVVKPGTRVSPGDPLILSVGEKRGDTFGFIKKTRPTFTDAAIVWDHDSEGVVTNVVETRDGFQVAVKAYSPMQVGDKLVGRFGDKGIVSAVVPDAEMPQGKDGVPYEVLLNPLGLITRVNPIQAIETSLGKIAEMTGKAQVIPSFFDGDYVEDTLNKLRKAGLKDTEDIYDPGLNKTVKDVFTGNRYFMKLHHMGECYDEETEVLTLDGWKYWKDVSDVDKLATVKNNKLTFETPRYLITQDYDGEIYGFSGKFVDYAVTFNHKMYARRYFNDKEDYRFYSVVDLHNSRFSVQQFGFMLDSDFETTQHNFTFDGVCISGEDFAELFGWWVTEGCVKPKQTSGQTYIYQSETANKDKFSKLVELVDTIGLRWKYYNQLEKREGVIIYGKELADYLGQFGRKCQYKHIPRDLLFSPLPARKRLYEAMMAGDGTVGCYPNRIGECHQTRFTTTSKKLADQFQELCISLGFGCIVHYRLPRQNHHLTSWSCNVHLTRTVAQVDGDRAKEGFYKRPYKGKTYCAEMSTGLLYVRRNGKPILCGNSKLSARDTAGYSIDETPVKGGFEGAKRLGLADINALLSHGAVEVLRDARFIRGQKNDDYWRAMKMGRSIPPVQVPLTWKKFVASLQAAGVDVTRRGGQIDIYGMTNSDIGELSKGRLSSGDTVDFRTGKPVSGGLFDPGIFGENGNQFGHMELVAPMPNPVMEDAIRSLLGLTKKDYENVIGEQMEVKSFGTGVQAIKQGLANLNIREEIEKARQTLRTARGQKRSEAIKRLGYLNAIVERNIDPTEFVWDRIPVLPPRFRPITDTGEIQLIPDANYLYKELFALNEGIKGLQDEFGPEDLGDSRLSLYRAVKAVTGLGSPTHPKLVEKKVRGILQQVFGSSPKYSLFQRKVLSSTMDSVGNAVITPDPSLDMDSVGVPEEMAWNVFKPYVFRSLVSSGSSPADALKAIENKSKQAKGVLLDEMRKRPVIITRAPVLHKYGIMAALPKLVTGNTLRISPSIVTGFNADFDGDQMRLHVPSSPKAVREAMEKMLPSRNILTATRFGPQQFIKNEFLLGLHLASKAKPSRRGARAFRSKRDAILAFKRGEIGVNDTIKIVS